MLLEDTPKKFERLHPLVIKVSKEPDSSLRDYLCNGWKTSSSDVSAK